MCIYIYIHCFYNGIIFPSFFLHCFHMWITLSPANQISSILCCKIWYYHSQPPFLSAFAKSCKVISQWRHSQQVVWNLGWIMFTIMYKEAVLNLLEDVSTSSFVQNYITTPTLFSQYAQVFSMNEWNIFYCLNTMGSDTSYHNLGCPLP